MTEILKLLNVYEKLNSKQEVYLECGIAAKSIEAFLLEREDALYVFIKHYPKYLKIIY